MPSDSRLETIRELEAKNWTLTFDVELKRQNVRRLEQRLQKEEEDGEQMEYDLDQKEKQLAQCEQERAALEEKVLTLQASLEEEKQRAEMAEDKAKAWEKKYIENAKQSIVSNVEGVAQSNTESAGNGKRKIYKRQHNPVNQRETYSMKVKEFIQNHIQPADQGNHKCLGTKTIYHAFQAHNDADEFAEMNFIHFSLEVAKHLTEIFPAARHKKTNQTKGYIGVQLNE
jgi:chromosome segregation ATPase